MIVFLIAIILLFFLLIENFYKIDFAATKNNGEMRSRIIRVEASQNIDSVKYELKKSIELQRNKFKNDSNAALTNIGAILILLVILFYFFNLIKISESKNA